MPLPEFANGEPFTAQEANDLARQGVPSMFNQQERDGADFGPYQTHIFREDTQRVERYYPPLTEKRGGARTPGWYPVTDKPYLDLYLEPIEFPTTQSYVIGSGSGEPYGYFTIVADPDHWNDAEGSLWSGPVVPPLEGIYRVSYRTSWNSNPNGNRIATIRKNGVEVPASRVAIDAPTNPAGHTLAILDIPMNGVDDYLDFGMLQTSGVPIIGLAYLTVEWVRPLQY